MNKDDRNKISEIFTFLSDFSEEDYEYFFNSITEKKYKINENIFDASNCGGLVFVKSGKVRVYMVSETGKEITLFYLNQGEACIMNYQCFLTDISFDVYFTAGENTEILLLPNSYIEPLHKKYFSLQKYFMSTMSGRISEIMWLVEQIAFTSLDKRIAHLLVNKNTKVIYITHDELAKELGTAREVVSRMLKYFEKNGVVKLSRSKVYIEDIEELKYIAGLTERT